LSNYFDLLLTLCHFNQFFLTLHQRWGTFLLNLGTLGLWVLELFAMYATDGRTDGRTKNTLPTGGGITSLREMVSGLRCTVQSGSKVVLSSTESTSIDVGIIMSERHFDTTDARYDCAT